MTTTAEARTAVRVRPVAGYTGADISGVDISKPLSAEEIAQIKDALHQYKVIFFRDQFLTHAQQVEFGAQFGKLTYAHPHDDAPPEDQPEIYTVDHKRFEERYGEDYRKAFKPATLSGGEAQRVALARALVREPQLMLLDEPFGALDALTRTRMHTLLQALCARHRPAVLLVTHDVQEAVMLADRAVVLTEGKISLDVPVGLPRPRDPAQPAFQRLRARLLAELGVDEHASVPVAATAVT